jgi:hypothetical protein
MDRRGYACYCFERVSDDGHVAWTTVLSDQISPHGREQRAARERQNRAEIGLKQSLRWPRNIAKDLIMECHGSSMADKDAGFSPVSAAYGDATHGFWNKNISLQQPMFLAVVHSPLTHFGEQIDTKSSE